MSQTLDQIFLSTAQKKPDAIALTTGPESARLGLESSREISYQNAALYINEISAFLRAFGFKEGDIILTQLPNIVETPLLLLGIMNAGLIPCLTPSQWRRQELEAALKTITPSAAIIHPSTPTSTPFDSIFEIAAQEMSLRFIFGLGNNLPDGVTPLKTLSPVISNNDATHNGEIVANEAPLFRRSGEQVAAIGWSHDPQGQPKPVAYTHIQLMANGYMLTERQGLEASPNILSSYNTTSLPGLIAAFIPWITEAGHLHLTTNLKIDDLSAAIAEHNINLAILPQGIKKALEGTIAPHTHLALVATSPARPQAKQENQDATSTISHLYNINGLTMVTSTNEPGNGLLKLGPQEDTNGNTPNPPFIETRLQGATQKAAEDGDVMKGRLELSGTAVGFTDWHNAITTSPLSNFDQHWEKTALTGRLVDNEMTWLEIETASDILYHGNHALNGPELDTLYQAYPGFIDAAAFSIKDPIMGERLFAAIIPRPGDSLSYEDFKNHLLAQQVSPAKIPEKLVTVTEIPRDKQGLIARSEILRPTN